MAYQANADGVGTATQVVVGLFNNANDAHQAITQLREHGFTSDQIGAAFRGSAVGGYDERYTPTGTTVAPTHEGWWEKVKEAFRPDERAEHEEAVSTGRAGSALDPRDYPQGDYEYDFASEDFAGSLAAAGIPAQRAAYLTRSLHPGGAIVTVRDVARTEEAEGILSANDANVRYEEVGGEDVASYGLPASRSAAGAEALPQYPTDGENLALDEPYAEQSLAVSQSVAGDRVQLFGEVLRVHKDRIHRGEVRIRKDVVTENQTIEVPVTREELLLERVPVSGTTPAPSANIGREQEIRVPLSEEAVRVEKQPVVREEYLVGKRDVSDVATVNEAVQHEELRVSSDVDASKRSAVGEELTEDVRRRG